MDKTARENYQVEDFIADESFVNYHFRSNKNDRLYWEDWLENHPSKKKIAREAQRMLDALSLNISEKEFNDELAKMSALVNRKNESQQLSRLSVSKKLPSSHRTRKRTMLYVLPLFLLLVSVALWMFIFSGKQSEILTETVNNSNSPLVLTLSDSTVVSIAPKASLKYPLHFGDGIRDVYLHGNAQFNVKRNVHHPFKVHAENIVTTVLGTIFNIKKSGDSAIVVELLKGKLNVAIMSPAMETEQSILLAPNERAVYVRDEKHLYKNLIIVRRDVTFSQNNFNQIAAQLKNIFGVTLINESLDKPWRFTGTFRNATAKEIVENICLVKKLSPSENDDTIYIK
jgi:transmembrane sensor